MHYCIIYICRHIFNYMTIICNDVVTTCISKGASNHLAPWLLLSCRVCSHDMARSRFLGATSSTRSQDDTS